MIGAAPRINSWTMVVAIVAVFLIAIVIVDMLGPVETKPAYEEFQFPSAEEAAVGAEVLPLWVYRAIETASDISEVPDIGLATDGRFDCADLEAARRLPVADEFDRRDRASQLAAAEVACSEEMDAAIRGALGDRNVLFAVPMALEGEYDFGRQEFTICPAKGESMRVIAWTNDDGEREFLTVLRGWDWQTLVLSGAPRRHRTDCSLSGTGLRIPVNDEHGKAVRERLVDSQVHVEFAVDPTAFGPTGITRNRLSSIELQGLMGYGVAFRVVDAEGEFAFIPWTYLDH